MRALGAVIGLAVGFMVARVVVVLLLAHWDFDDPRNAANWLRLWFVVVLAACGVAGGVLAQVLHRRAERHS